MDNLTRARSTTLRGRRLLGRYNVHERIAQGGMGVVFRGDDERLDRPVCVKVFLPLDPSRPEYDTVLGHFIQEAFTLSRLHHPNTLRIYDFGYLDEAARTGPFFVTEFAEGGTLFERVEERGGLEPDHVLSILEPLVGALEEAHARGVVHRDIKPSNVLFTTAGGASTPKLCDFSIAKAVGDFPNRAAETKTEFPLYSASWASPEQMVGRAVGPTADVFSLALMTAYMLTGGWVYEPGAVMKTFAQRAEGDVFRRSRLQTLIERDPVRRVLERGCAEDPAARHVSARHFLGSLREALGDDDRVQSREELEVTAVTVRPPDPEETSTPFETRLGLRPVALPADPSRPARPVVHITSVDESRAAIAGRWVRFVEASPRPLAFRALDGADDVRIRVTPMQVQGRVHIKSLNCFVGLPGGRASSGLDVHGSAELSLISLQQTLAARILVAVGRGQNGQLVCELPDATLSIDAGAASWAAIVDCPSAREAFIVYVTAAG